MPRAGELGGKGRFVHSEVHGQGRHWLLALFPADRAVPLHARHFGVQVRLNAMRLERPRQWEACWLFTQLWSQLQLDEFWKPLLPESREGTSWYHTLLTLCAYRLIDPGSEWRLHRLWFEQSAMADLLEEDFSLAAITSTVCSIRSLRTRTLCDGRELLLRRRTEPNLEQRLFLAQLQLALPEQPPPQITKM